MKNSGSLQKSTYVKPVGFACGRESLPAAGSPFGLFFLLALSVLPHSAKALASEALRADTLKENRLKILPGVRLSFDGALFNPDVTPLTSGLNVSEARLRLKVSRKEWEIYTDFDFADQLKLEGVDGRLKLVAGKGSVSLKDAYFNYKLASGKYFKAGYSREPFSIANLTSEGSMHFIAKPGSVTALAPGRALGMSYLGYGKRYFSHSGVFLNDGYQSKTTKVPGLSLTERYVYIATQKKHLTFQAGFSGRYKKIQPDFFINSSKAESYMLKFSAPLETYVDKSVKFNAAEVTAAHVEFKLGAEALLITPKFYVQGEFIRSLVSRKAENYDGFGREGVSFEGAYVELGYLLRGGSYDYKRSDALLGGLSACNDLELVARYGFTGLNALSSAEVKKSPSLMGGTSRALTGGLNYNLSSSFRFLLHYTCAWIEPGKLSDRKVDMLQLRAQLAI